MCWEGGRFTKKDTENYPSSKPALFNPQPWFMNEYEHVAGLTTPNATLRDMNMM